MRRMNVVWSESESFEYRQIPFRILLSFGGRFWFSPRTSFSTEVLAKSPTLAQARGSRPYFLATMTMVLAF